MKVKPVILFLLAIIFCGTAAFGAPVKPSASEIGASSSLGDIASSMPNPAARMTAQPYAYPTNKWWGSMYIDSYYHLIYGNVPSQLTSLGPMLIKYATAGFKLSATNLGIRSGGADLASLLSETGYLQLFVSKVPNTRQYINSPVPVVTKYSDWSVTTEVRDSSNPDLKMTTTFAKGSMFVYSTFSNGTYATFQLGWSGNLSFNNGDGGIISQKGQWFGIFVPEGTTFQSHDSGGSPGGSLGVNFPAEAVNEEDRYVVLAYLGKGDDYTLEEIKQVYLEYRKYAYNFITDTKVTWTQNSDSSISTVFEYTLEPRRTGDGLVSGQTLFALYPHQWRYLDPASFAVPSTVAPEYTTLRGKLKVYTGSNFTTKYAFNGILPNLTYEVPEAYRSKLETYINAEKSFNITSSANNTYRRGKTLAKAANLIPVFHQAGKFAERDAMLAKLKNELISWYSGSSGNHSFKYDAAWGGIIGVPYDFGTELYNDHHFHYGYFVYASAILAMYDPDFASDSQFKGMVELLIRDFASPDRNDKSFPFLRTFDVYEGHSWSNGKGTTDAGDDGTDQESISEAVNAWAGIYLWGVATNNPEWIKLGMYGYTTESKASEEYYFDIFEETYPAAFMHRGGILYDNAIKYRVHWEQYSPTAQEKYGIWILPLTPSMLYLGYNPDKLESYMTRLAAETVRNDPEMWKDIFLRYEALYDAPSALAKWNSWGSPSSEEGSSLTFSYQFINFFNARGTVDTTYYADNASYGVMKKDSENTFIAYNPDLQNSQNVTFYSRTGGAGKTMKVPPRTIASSDANFKRLKLDPITGYVAQFRTDYWDASVVSGVNDFTAEPFLKISSATLPVTSDNFIYLDPCFTLTKTNASAAFVNPVTVELNYSDFSLPATVVEDELRIAYLDPSAQTVTLLSALPDTVNKTITVTTSAEGAFYLVEPQGYYAQYAGSSWVASVFGHYSDFTSDPELSLRSITLPSEDEWFIYIGPAFEFSANPAASFNNAVPMVVEYGGISLPSGTDENKLRLACIDSLTGKIEVLPDFDVAPDIHTHTLTVNTNITGKFILVLPLDTPRKLKVKVYPNPYKPGKYANSGITFGNIKQGAHIRIYNIAGEKVYDKKADRDNFVWDVKNNSGNNIASGVYIYFIESNGRTYKGKIAIER